MITAENINNNEEYHDIPLWCVYGAASFPSIVCCKALRGHDGTVNIWGYSVYRNSPGFRTIGMSVLSWAVGSDMKFFTTIDGAFAELKKLLTPKGKAIKS